MKLFYGGNALEDNKTLSEYDIATYSIVQLII